MREDLDKRNRTALCAVIWDMDGVLVDSEPLHFATWREVLGRHAVRFSEQKFREALGMTSTQVIRSIADAHLPDKQVARIVDEKEHLF